MVTISSIPRRKVLVGGLALSTIAVASSPRAVASPIPAVVDSVRKLEQQNRSRIGLYARDFQTGQVITHRHTERFAMCSSVKTYIAARILQKADRRDLALTDTVVVNSADILPNSPVTEIRISEAITLAEMCAAALQRSDNAATNYLLQIVGGPPDITEFARSIGDMETRLDRWEPELNSAIPGDVRDTSTPQALGDGNQVLIAGSVLAPESRGQLIEWMASNVTSSLRPGMPPGWVLADKTGSGDYGSTNDVGIAFGSDGRQVLLSVMMRSTTDDPDTDGYRPVMAEIAALVIPALTA